MFFTFENPQYLWLFLIVPLFLLTHLFTLRRTHAVALKFANFEAIQKVAKGSLAAPYIGKLKNRDIVLVLFKTLIFVFLVLAFARTTVWYQGEAAEYSYIIALDTSTSMLSEDIPPTRLEASKQAAKTFVETVPPKTNLGFVTFHSNAFVITPITRDKEIILEGIGGVEERITGATDLGEAITTSTNQLIDEKGLRSIILLSDGADTSISKLQEDISYASKQNVLIHTIKVGTSEGGYIEALNLSLPGSADNETLIEISEKTNGVYFESVDQEQLEQAFAEIAGTEETNIPVDLTFTFILGSLLLLFILWTWLYNKYRTTPQ